MASAEGKSYEDSQEQCPVHFQERGNCRRLGYEQEGKCLVEPTSPISAAEATGFELKTIYEANINAGFGPAQSIYLLAVAMTGHPGIAPGDGEDTSHTAPHTP